MNAEIKARWVEALRSGRYLPGRRALHQDGAYCCLGVLCEVVGGGEWEPFRLATGQDAFIYRTPGIGVYGHQYPPEAVQAAAGLTYDQCIELAAWNDDLMSFPTIAALIEEKL